MSGHEIMEFVKTFGFPGAVAFFVLWRLDARLGKISEGFADLVAEIRVANQYAAGIKEHMTQVGQDVVREVDKNTRAVVWQR